MGSASGSTRNRTVGFDGGKDQFGQMPVWRSVGVLLGFGVLQGDLSAAEPFGDLFGGTGADETAQRDRGR